MFESELHLQAAVGYGGLSTKYSCGTQDDGCSQQKEPLWSETFEVDLGSMKLTVKNSVGPQIAPTTTMLIKNGGDDGLAAVIWDIATQESSIAVYYQEPGNIRIQRKKNDSQTHSLFCSI